MLLLTLERATPRLSQISSAGSGLGAIINKAWTCATARLIPQRQPISPQWRMNFSMTGVSFMLISVITEMTFVKPFSLSQSARRAKVFARRHRT
jgi:hypothetical protein